MHPVAPIPFQLDKENAPASLTYRPWGTRTLKVKITTSQTTPVLRLRPQGVRQEEARQGIFQAYADNSDAFCISWGGGHETGPCVKAKDFLVAFEKCGSLTDGDVSVIYFNLTHIGPDLPATATVTLEAYDEKTGAVSARCPIHLTLPPGFPDQPARLQATTPGNWQTSGDHLAVYDPRWWPREIRYVPAGDLPLAVIHQQNSLSVQWQGQPVATISDHTDPSLLESNAVSYELFYFDEWHLALRVWFFWTDSNIGGGFFIGRHEVPDAERFDLLIRRQDGKVTLACTDLHWREVWGEVTDADKILEATLGLTRTVKKHLAEEKMSAWLPWKEKEMEHKRVYNPMGFIERAAETRGTEKVGTQRAKGTEAHLPMLHNVEQTVENGRPPRMTSSDVRLG